MKSRHAIFNETELEFIKDRAGTMSNAELRDEFVAQFGRADIAARQIHYRCARRGWPRGRPQSSRQGKSHLHGGNLMVGIDASDRYRRMQRIVWEEIVGPLPKGYMLIPLNGDKFDFDPFNWIMLTNAMANRLRQSTFFDAPPELRPTIFAAAKLKQTIKDRTNLRLRQGRRSIASNSSTRSPTSGD